MRSYRRILGLSGVLSTLAALAAALPAQAQSVPQAAAACAVQGVAKATPPVDPLQLDCVLSTTTANTATGAHTVVSTINVTSSGTFTAGPLCATGHMSSTSNVVTVASSTPAAPAVDSWVLGQGPNLDWDISWIGTAGHMEFRDDPGNARGAGPVTVTCTSDIEVSGWVAFVLP
jgi:hypothetical protein